MVSVASSTFECNAFDLSFDPIAGMTASVDQGGNVCGCTGATAACKALSASLTPPRLPTGM